MDASLGYVTVPTPGTPVRATINNTDPTLRVGAQSITFQALPGNTGIVYVGRRDMDTSTGVGVLGLIPAPSDPTTGPFPSWAVSLPVIAAGLNVADHYIDAAEATDGVVVAYTQG